MNIRRLLRLAAFLDTMPREKFDFGTIAVQGEKPMLKALAAGHRRCGSAACAIGWMPAVFPQTVRWKRDRRDIMWSSGTPLQVAFRSRSRKVNFEVAATWFGISSRESDVLFSPGSSGFGLRGISERATPRTVARRIRRFIAWKQTRRTRRTATR